jgi:hypothetical protein
MDLVAEQESTVIPVVMFTRRRSFCIFRVVRAAPATGIRLCLNGCAKSSDPRSELPLSRSPAAQTMRRFEPASTTSDDGDDALVGLVSGGWMNGDAAVRALSDAVANASVPGKASLAAAMRRQPSALFERALVQMAGARDVQVRARVAEAMARMPSTQFLPSLLRRQTKLEAAETMLFRWAVAVDFFSMSLHDEGLPRMIRIGSGAASVDSSPKPFRALAPNAPGD